MQQEQVMDATTETMGITIRELGRGEDGTAFRVLNEEWITKLFTLEARDREVLGDPETHILSKGGHIYLVEKDGEAVGCVALIPEEGHGLYEVSKMAVSPTLRGLGIGRKLLEYTIARAREIGATALYLGSSKKLKNAVHLYEALGFRHVDPKTLPEAPYSRADVFMHMGL
ncbi:GNAT family N-acetyltransferase [Granulicella sibirica]|uniref:GCN5-related N-acetyltransferase n=1 Tax=Granulicella sibirica TaxID=2479048 RepID=A0A4Q0SVB9_9BACT|nr:GNAT family N-acetyltransferase [Granulicella sibirica]RXH55015.1 GCN5-related N-acetyltransferase [Granulicella sibirica]